MPQTLNNWESLAEDIKRWGVTLGFSQIGITDTDLSAAEPHHREWIAQGFHGAMDYMAKHGDKRTRPAELVPGTIRIISARMDYMPPNARDSEVVMQDSRLAFISRYALGRDYHKVLRNRLQKLSDMIAQQVGEFGYRVFTDSAPVLEVELAQKAGLGWRGKHTLLLSRNAGSWFFLGEIYTDLPLPIDKPISGHCGKCTACIDVCPTQAIIAPYQVDARRCISYLTIELKDSIPEHLRPLIGNRVYGCDDCQLTCPWNRFAQVTQQDDFHVRHGLDNISLVELFKWDEVTFNEKMAGSAIYRIGHIQWLRNLAVGLGNAATTPEVIEALEHRRNHPSELVREHVAWALNQHKKKR
ncbi:tRNA epoxyqueuosine(34) reductase QueG [Methylobacillus flagellatus]|uniref:Epoxyqueuosine reductase n=1 Tax=Methylobacillus flagellatus (strain ATCC 51484 / DSM 6875 / VKM B-1610 / KT) TaxID=265072 RepID=Q1H1J0_METFK|nr:tRNA epoxyqueuosine(34) reductase QueG [Methylobacillus flagellatus]ABE49647.1 4Fe-4S cluster binding protein [Methylobacillus flagellatus KT]